MNDRSQYLKIMKEWHCCSNDYAYIYLFFTALSAFVCFLYLSNTSFKDQDFFIISIALFAAVVTFIFWKLYKTQRKNIVNMHYSHGYVKIDMGLAKGKKQHDKRQSSKEKDWNREKQRLLKQTR